MATNRKKAGKAKSRAKTTGKSTAKKGAKRTAKPTKGVDPAQFDSKLPPNAADTNPDMPVSEALSDAGRRAKEADRQRKHLSKLPNFNVDLLLAALKGATTALEDGEYTWESTRRADRPTSLNKVAENARAYQASILSAARFLFRDDAATLAKLDAIAAGEGLADQIEDLGALGKIVAANSALFDALPKTRDAAAKLADFRQKLLDGSDSTTALEAQKARNLAFWRLDYLSNELYRALVFVLEQQGLEPARVVNLRGFETRERIARRVRQAGKKPEAPGTK